MYTALGANDRIRELFSKADRTLTVPSLEGLLDNHDLDAVCNAAEILLFLEGQKAIRIIAKLLEHEDEAVRGAACRILSGLRSAEVIALLVKRLQIDPAGGVRYVAADCLKDIGDMSVIEALRQCEKNDTGCNFEDRSVSDCARKAIEVILRRERMLQSGRGNA
jgi:HEAT repeat protein